MSNHFHLLVRVPHRSEGFDVPLEVILARMERAIGDEVMALVRTQLDLWTRSGSHGYNRCRGGQSRWHNRKHQTSVIHLVWDLFTSRFDSLFFGGLGFLGDFKLGPLAEVEAELSSAPIGQL
jgi:hypothetical protein